MNIAEFIDLACGWFRSTDAKLDAATKAATTENEKLKADLASARTERDNAAAAAATATKRADTADALLADAVAKTEKLATTKANEIAAAQGVPPIKEAAKANPIAAMSKDELWAEYARFTDNKAKREFYLANKDRM